VQHYLPEGHLARFVVAIVEQLDLRALLALYAGKVSKELVKPALQLAG
jgi:transposase